jgi:hypothetical protein
MSDYRYEQFRNALSGETAQAFDMVPPSSATDWITDVVKLFPLRNSRHCTYSWEAGMRVNSNGLELGSIFCLIGFIAVIAGSAASQSFATASETWRGSQTRATTTHRARTVLARVKVHPGQNFIYELSIAPCGQKSCPFRVRLLQGKNRLSSVDLDWVKANGPATKEAIDESSGVGDPLQPDKGLTAWSTGDEKENVSTVARSVRLTSNLNGLLIDRRAGFDELKRHHDVFVAVNNKLLRAWSDEEGPGPSWSTVALSPARTEGSQDILYFKGFRSPSDIDPDRLLFFKYRWDSAKNKFVEPETQSEVFAVIAGAYDSVSKARQVQAGASCIDPVWVLRSDTFSTLTLVKFVLAAVTTRKPLADTKAAEIKSCAPQLSVSVITSPYHQPEE